MCAPVRVTDHHGWAHLPKPDTAADAPPQVRIVPQANGVSAGPGDRHARDHRGAQGVSTRYLLSFQINQQHCETLALPTHADHGQKSVAKKGVLLCALRACAPPLSRAPHSGGYTHHHQWAHAVGTGQWLRTSEENKPKHLQLGMDNAFSGFVLLASLLLLQRANRLLLLLLLGNRTAPAFGIELSIQDLLLRQGGQPLDELRRRRLVPLHGLLGGSHCAARGPPGQGYRIGVSKKG